MSIETTYTNARQNLARLLDAATKDRETIVVKRRGAEDAAIVAADELRSLEETAHLLRSPANARRLLDALEGAIRGEGETLTFDELRRRVGLDEEE